LAFVLPPAAHADENIGTSANDAHLAKLRLSDAHYQELTTMALPKGVEIVRSSDDLEGLLQALPPIEK
jgi:hypothetical protein